MGRLCILILTLIWAMPVSAEWVDWIAEGELAFEYTDNLNQSAFHADERTDASWHPSASLGRVYQLTDRTRLSFTAEAQGRLYHRFERLNASRFGARLSAFHKLGFANAPWLRASLAGGYMSVRQGERSGAFLEAGLTLGKRFSPRFDAALSYLFTRRDGRSGSVAIPTIDTDVFDQEAHQLSVEANYLLTPQLLVSAGYSFRYGDFDAACTGSNVPKVVSREGGNLRAISVDPVFGGCVYRLKGEVHSGSLHLNYGISDRWSADLGYRFTFGEARRLEYVSNTVRLTVMFRY